MRGRWELSDARWRTIEPILRRSDAPTGEGVRGKIREPCSTGFYGYWAVAHSGANSLGNIRRTRPATAAFSSGYESASWSRSCRS